MKDELELLIEARNQIEYLQEKFQETGTGNAVLARLNNFIEDNDIDLDKDRSVLLELSEELGRDIYILRESDGRFLRKEVNLDKAVFIYHPNGNVSLGGYND